MAPADPPCRAGEIARNAVLKLNPPTLDFPAREVLVPRVDRLEFATVDGHARTGEQAHLPTQPHELRAYLFDTVRTVRRTTDSELSIF